MNELTECDIQYPGTDVRLVCDRMLDQVVDEANDCVMKADSLIISGSDPADTGRQQDICYSIVDQVATWLFDCYTYEPTNPDAYDAVRTLALQYKDYQNEVYNVTQSTELLQDFYNDVDAN